MKAFISGALLFLLSIANVSAQIEVDRVVQQNEVSAKNYLVGRGAADVTGPAVGMPLWGFGRPDQIGEGLHTRLASRAFIVGELNKPAKRLVFVSVDLGSIDHHIVLAVAEILQGRYGNLYGLHNVIISATHTHAGPTGYWHSRTDTGLDGGFYPEHYDAIVEGIADSIISAHEDLEPGNVFINTGRVENGGANRSAVAYLANPVEERARYTDDTNTTMTLLKFTDGTGAIGLINWYALHPTAMNYYNRFVSGDHKGYASLAAERAHDTPFPVDNEFVAAFAQSDPGDVTPNINLDNTGPGDTDLETTKIMGERQVVSAHALFDSAREKLSGPIDSRQMYINLKNYEVDGRFTGSGVQHTCPSAYGYSFAGGSTEDGGGHFLFKEGMTEQSAWRDWLIRLVTGAPAWTEEVRLCQAPKAILFETGSQTPPLQSQVHSVTVARIGQFVILAMPGEVTTMAGRRLRDTVMHELSGSAKYVVLAGYANEFAGYITTPEEYDLQQYEAAHNLHGRWSLPAYQQVASQLAAALQADQEIDSQQAYDDWRGRSIELPLPYRENAADHGEMKAGDVVSPVRTNYSPTDTATVEFLSADPSRHFATGNNFLEIRRKEGDDWQTVATDTDWSTRVSWRFTGGRAIAMLEWAIPKNIAPGTYQIRHFGVDKNSNNFVGATEEFSVKRTR